MNIFERAAGFSGPQWGKQVSISLMLLVLFLVANPQKLSATQDAQAPAPAQDTQAPAQDAQAPPYTQQTPSSCSSW